MTTLHTYFCSPGSLLANWYSMPNVGCWCVIERRELPDRTTRTEPVDGPYATYEDAQAAVVRLKEPQMKKEIAV